MTDSLKRSQKEAQDGINAINKIANGNPTEEQQREIKLKKNIVSAYQCRIEVHNAIMSFALKSANYILKSAKYISKEIKKRAAK